MVYRKKQIIFLFSFCALLLTKQIVFAQTETNPNGYNVFYYSNGIKSSEGFLKNGKPDGYWKNYSEQGIIKSEGNRKGGTLDSIWKFYDEKGKITTEYTYKLGKKKRSKKNL